MHLLDHPLYVLVMGTDPCSDQPTDRLVYNERDRYRLKFRFESETLQLKPPVPRHPLDRLALAMVVHRCDKLEEMWYSHPELIFSERNGLDEAVFRERVQKQQ